MRPLIGSLSYKLSPLGEHPGPKVKIAMDWDAYVKQHGPGYVNQLTRMMQRAYDWRKAHPQSNITINWHMTIDTVSQALARKRIQTNQEGLEFIQYIVRGEVPEPTCLMLRAAIEYEYKQ